jgi:hypothetical protein
MYSGAALGKCELIRTYANFARFRLKKLKNCFATILNRLPTAFALSAEWNWLIRISIIEKRA